VIELTVVCVLLVALLAWQAVDRRAEQREVCAERADLLQRIQAPQAAVVAHHYEQPADEATELVPDDDEAWWASRESRDELAERMMAEETAGG